MKARQQHERQKRQQRREILSEEDYTSTLSSIIQRDYFPESNSLLHQNALLDRRLQGDVAGAVSVRRAARRLMEQEEANANQRRVDDEDLLSISSVSEQPRRKRARPLGDETVTGFHARVTNEDDHEFEKLQQEEVEANRARLRDVFHGDHHYKAITNGGDGNSNKQHTFPVQLRIEDELASDDFTAEPNRIAASEWRRPTTKNSFFFSPDASTDDYNPTLQNNEDGQQKLVSAASAESSTARFDIATTTTSAPMLPPTQQQTKNMLIRRQAGPKTTNQHNDNVELSKHELVEYIPKQVLEEKKINPSQTRFPTSNNTSAIPRHSTGIVNLSSSHSSDFSDTDEIMSVTDASQYSTDLDAPLLSVEEERRNRQRQQHQSQQHHNHRSYVAMTPQIQPGPSGRDSPITTWGELDGTPLVLSGRQEEQSASGSRSEFTLASETEREKAARQAASELARRAKRAKESSSSSRHKKRGMSSSSSSSVHIRRRGGAESLTPAAMALLGKTSSSKLHVRDKFSSSLRRSYTPKLSSTSSSSSRRSASAMSTKTTSHGTSRDHAFNATPLLGVQKQT
jgi:protein DGCR14